MASAVSSIRERREERSRFVAGLLRGGAGALIFALPMMMTMELWQLGSTIAPVRLLLSAVLTIPLLFALSQRIGFERTFTWQEALRDAIIAYALGIAASVALLALFAVLLTDMPVDEWIGKIALQAIPASIGALLGRSQLGGNQEDEEGPDGQSERDQAGQEKEGSDAGQISTSYPRELFMMAVGALFLSLNVAPTEEVILISYKMSHWHTLATVIFSIAVMHGFVYALAFRGGHELSPNTPRWHAFVRFTVPGYVVAFAISLYVLWVFGRLDDTAATEALVTAVVLALPASIGAAAARLIL